MIVLGLILVLLAVAAGVILFLTTDSISDTQPLEFAGYSWGMTPLALLITGAVVLLLLWLGLALIRASVKRRRRPAREAKEAERQARLEESIRADERARAEETHRTALTERDRVRDEEFESRLADRDAERERDFATRQQEAEERARAYERSRLEDDFAARRAGERQAADTGAVGGGAMGAGAVGAGAVGAGAGAAGAVTSDHDRDDQVTDSAVTHTPAVTGDSYAAGHSADAPVDSSGGQHSPLDGGYPLDARTTEASGHDSNAATAMTAEPEPHDVSDPTVAPDHSHSDESTRVIADEDRAGPADGARDDESVDDGSVDDGTSDEPTHPGHRTVADKIMGRHPEDRE